MNRIRTKIGKFGLAFVLTFGLGLGANSLLHAQVSSPTFYTGFGGDFSLHGENGPERLSELPGKWKLLTFGYSHCPDICSILLSKIQSVYKQVSPAEGELGVVFVSIDHRADFEGASVTRDNGVAQSASGQTGSEKAVDSDDVSATDDGRTTPVEQRKESKGLHALQAFVSRFNPAFVGLSGSPADLASVKEQYGIFVGDRAGMKGHFSHTDRIFLTNEQGQVAKLYGRDSDYNEIAADLRVLLAR